MFRVVLIGAVLSAGPGAAEGWQVLDGAGIGTALTARVLGYADGSLQDFKAGGDTLYDSAGRSSAGRWAVRGDQYCSVWPPSDQWACYGVAVSGNRLRFTAGDGSETIGTYVDLN